MKQTFSTTATAVVFDRIANDPDAYEMLQEAVLTRPAESIQEIRTFIEERSIKRLPQGTLERELAEAGLRDVRLTELRQALKDEAA